MEEEEKIDYKLHLHKQLDNLVEMGISVYDLEVVNKQAIRSNYILKDKLKFVLSKLNISDIEPWSTYKIDGQILFDLQELL